MANNSYIVTDLSYGDAGKGTTVDYLARQSKSSVVVRYNGASQAAHNVVTPQGTHHVFSQFGSGSLASGSKTFLSKYMLINPLNMLNEANHLVELGISDIWENTFVDRKCIVITPWHEATNRLNEVLRDKNRHGSCGHGVGEAVKDSLTFPELTIRVDDFSIQTYRDILFLKLSAIRNHKLNELKILENIYDCKISSLTSDLFTSNSYINDLLDGYFKWASLINFGDIDTLSRISNNVESIIFEGAQGVLLDENWGFFPHTTWSNTTGENALALLKEIDFDGAIKRLGIIRAYTTRHGAGPFVTEDSYVNEHVQEKHNTLGLWQGNFRMGWLDLVAHKYAIDVNGGIDGIVINGLDQIRSIPDFKVCKAYGFSPDYIAEDLFKVADTQNGYEIRVGKKYDLNHKEKLALALQEVLPIYENIHGTVPKTEQQLIQLCENILGSKVILKSYGPAATDKVKLDLYLRRDQLSLRRSRKTKESKYYKNTRK